MVARRTPRSGPACAGVKPLRWPRSRALDGLAPDAR
jgi:hypothetical protein